MKDNFLSLISVNIEKRKHLDKVQSFVVENNPDIVCFQEIAEIDFENLKKDFGMDGIFAPMVIYKDEVENMTYKMGVAILSKNDFVSKDIEYYFGNIENIPVYDKEFFYKTINKVLAIVEINKNNSFYRIATTHFTWTPDGLPNEYQVKDLEQMLKVTQKYDSLILCGDFNAPRGGEIFSKISEKYKDNIPTHYESSIDPILHRKKDLRLMVDGLFSTPDYEFKNVELISGVSDHMAVKGKLVNSPASRNLAKREK